MTITVQYPNPQYKYDFDIKGAFKTDKEIFLVGTQRDLQGIHMNKDYVTVIGIIVNKQLDCLCYGVKQQKSQKYYDKLISCKVGSTVQIHSDVSTGMWAPVDAVKIDLQPVIDCINRCNKFKEVMKTPGGLMVPN